MSDGVFQTDREIFNNPVWKNILKFRLFFYIYGNAVYLDAGKDYTSIHINRGQFLKSYRKLQEGLEYIENHAVKQYSLSQISRAIDELIEEKRIKKTDTELGTLFTVCNYEEYQGFERFKEDSIEQIKNTDGTLMEQMRNNNKKDNKDKNDKKLKDICALAQFHPPMIDEVKVYCKERSNKVDPEKWHDFYTAKNWMIGKNKMKDWKAAVRTWEHENKSPGKQAPQAGNFTQRPIPDDLDNFYKDPCKEV